MSFMLAKEKHIAKANIDGIRKYSPPLLGGATKFYNKGHENKERKRIRSSNAVYHSGLQGEQKASEIVY